MATRTPDVPSSDRNSTLIPLPYRLFFLYFEPIATVVGAYYAFFAKTTYLSLIHPLTAAVGMSTRESIVLSQLANLYFVFAFNEAVILRATSDIRLWKVVLLGLLIADFGHIWSVHELGWHTYWRVDRWSAIDWGNLGFVYAGACARIAFLLGLGLTGETRAQRTSADDKRS